MAVKVSVSVFSGLYFSIQIFACFLVTEPQPNPELLPVPEETESEDMVSDVIIIIIIMLSCLSSCNHGIFISQGEKILMDEETGESYVTPRETLRRRELYMLWLTRCGHGLLILFWKEKEVLDWDPNDPYCVQVLRGLDHSVRVWVLQSIWTGNIACFSLVNNINTCFWLVRPSSRMTTSSSLLVQSAPCSIALVRLRC